MKIVIIGAGFSGTMCAVHLMKNASSPLQIFLVEKKEIARGVAYANTDDCFLLNVRADQMGAFPDNPGHFYEWLQIKNIKSAPTDFISRKIFGDYLEDLLEETRKKTIHTNIQIIKDEVLDLDMNAKTIFLKNSEPIIADKVILATGLDSNPVTHLLDLKNTEEPLTIIGTGLSMVDAVVYLDKINYKGKITAVSRHGRLPSHHKFYPADTPKPTYDFQKNHSLAYALKLVKENLKQYEWRLVIDALRPHNQFLWKNWSDKEKSQFYRHCRSLWDVHRHRMSHEHKVIIDRNIADKKLEIKKAGYRPYTPKTKLVLEVKGLSLGGNTDNKLIQNLLAKKIIEKDFLNLGIQSDQEGNISGNWIYTLGPLRRGQLWECTAVPEIRQQAKALVEILLK